MCNNIFVVLDSNQIKIIIMSEGNLGDELKDKAAEASEKAKEIASDAADAAKETAAGIKDEWNKMTDNGDNKKILAGLLANFFGGLGIHKFILGYTKEGVIMLVLSVITCGTIGSIIGLIEGIMYLTKSDEEFYNTYQIGKKGWF